MERHKPVIGSRHKNKDNLYYLSISISAAT